MPLDSLNFLLFFAVVVAVYFSLPSAFRTVFFLSASYFFYLSFGHWCVLFLLLLTLVSYTAGLLVEKEADSRRRKLIVACASLLSAGTLFVFKYVPFFYASFYRLFFSRGGSVPALKLLAPVGISFYTFRGISYVIDVYRAHRNAETNLVSFSLYIAFFPLLLAGPIDRSTQLLPQFVETFGFDYDRVTDGIKLMLYGFFEKMVVADTLATLVDPVFNNPSSYPGFVLSMAAILFSFQIYADFSGYSDIAIGAAQVFGYRSMKNFDLPYFSQSIHDFWRRWHMSLSFWFRDYLYIPLGGNRLPVPLWYASLLVVFLASGLWHGSNWTFIVWGGIHGLYYVFSHMTRGLRARLAGVTGIARFPDLHGVMRALITFLLVSFAWVFFRANTIADALYIVTHLFTGWADISHTDLSAVWSPLRLAIGIASAACMVLVDGVRRTKGSARVFLSRRPIWLRWAVYYAAITAILLLGQSGAKQFIYFQF